MKIFLAIAIFLTLAIAASSEGLLGWFGSILIILIGLFILTEPT
jgi:hypothetical protein